MWRFFSAESRTRPEAQLGDHPQACGATLLSPGQLWQPQKAVPRGVEGEGGYNVASLEWKVDTVARGIERVCGDLG